jgi:uncharacterized protein (TIGR02646 family)
MKAIAKHAEPQELIDWKAQANADWQPSFGVLAGELKRTLKLALMREQGWICCYCERRLEENDAHIEHFRPQHDPAVDALEYANLLCSCQSNLAKGAPRHCGNLKGDWFDAQLLVSPFDPHCAERFAYTGDGRISAANETDRAALETIRKLGLDLPKLNALRAQAIEPFLAPDLSYDELRTFVSGYLRPDAQHRFGEFSTTISHLFGAYVAP